MFLAGRDLHYRVYLRAAKVYREGWKAAIEIPPVPGTNKLNALYEDGLPELEPDEQAKLMREARFEDSAELLEMVDLDQADGDEFFAVAAFAFRGGHYETAADLYGRWFSDRDTPHPADMLNRAAWQLYLARESVDTAVAMARTAYSLDPSADIADTLARLLYISGESTEAIEYEKKAVKLAEGGRADGYREVVDKMTAGLELDDKPAFETYPGPREISL
jgi:tetratricopeptide (TPR) repeat protein